MKNYLTLVLALAVVSSPAYASRARLEALGEGKNGSYYIDDGRNMFLNPATIVHNKKKLMLELGSPAPSTFVENNLSSRAQGGFTNTFGDYTYALYLNNVSDTAAAIGALTGSTPDNAIELQFAGEGAMNWGLAVTTAGMVDGSAAQSASYWGARAGIEKDALAVFGTVGISSNNKGLSTAALAPVPVGTAVEVKGNLKLDLAATYKMDNMTAFAKFSTTSNDATVLGTTTTAKTTVYGAGLGWKKEMTKSTNMFTRLEGDYSQDKTGDNVTGKSYNVPVVMGAEAQALSWLAIRGSISHSLLGKDIQNNASFAGTSTVAAGVGMTFGDVTVDGLVASGQSAFASGTPAVVNPAPTAADHNFGFGDNMISRIAMTYNF